MRILHLSDTHLTRAAGPNGYGVDPEASLRQMLDDCHDVPGIDLLLVTGDVADDGSPEAYRKVSEIVGKFAGPRGIPVIFGMGNHDERAGFAEVLGSGHDAPVTQATGDEIAAVSEIAGFRIVTIDSVVPGKAYGELSQAQLTWLRDVLARPAPLGTVLALHHSPVMVPGIALQQAFGLQNGAELAAAIRGSDVRIVLCGHFHLQLFGMLEGVPVWATPGVVNRVDLTAAPDTQRIVKGASATVIDLGVPGAPLLHTLHARDPQAGETGYATDPAETVAVIESNI